MCMCACMHLSVCMYMYAFLSVCTACVKAGAHVPPYMPRDWRTVVFLCFCLYMDSEDRLQLFRLS